jgi:hypothetical protein
MEGKEQFGRTTGDETPSASNQRISAEFSRDHEKPILPRKPCRDWQEEREYIAESITDFMNRMSKR